MGIYGYIIRRHDFQKWGEGGLNNNRVQSVKKSFVLLIDNLRGEENKN